MLWRVCSAPLSLRTRLSLLVGFIVALVVGAAAFLELRMFTARMESELIGGARITARAVADDVELREADDTASKRRSCTSSSRSIRPFAPSRSSSCEDQTPKTVLSTSSEERRPRSTSPSGRSRWATRSTRVAGLMRFVAVPFVGPQGPMAVVVTVSTTAVDRVARDGRLLALYVMLPAIVIVTVLLDWLARRLVHRRIGGIRETMQRVAGGDLRARAEVERPDEIGAIVSGLNSMLSEMEGLSESLQTRVRDATAELRERNAEVEEMYQRVFDLREALAKAEQLAAVGQAAANVAHQVGTPLNLVSGYVQMLLSDPSLDTRTRRRLEMMQRQIEQVTCAVRGLLDRARRTVQRVEGRARRPHRAGAGDRTAAAGSQSCGGYRQCGVTAAAHRGGFRTARARAAQPGHQRHRRHGRRRVADGHPHAARRRGAARGCRQRSRRA